MLNFESEMKNKYDIHHTIGKGHGGEVYAATRLKDGLPVAIKVVKKAEVMRWGEIDSLKVPIEFELLSVVSGHPNIITMIEWMETEHEYVLVMDRQEGSKDIFKIMQSVTLTVKMAKIVFLQIAEATLHCHDKGVVHGDIYESNVLFDKENLQAKLIDFGEGTRFKDSYSFKCEGDTLSLGHLLLTMVNNNGKDNPGDPDRDSCDELIDLLLPEDPENMITIEKALKHPCLDDVRNDE